MYRVSSVRMVLLLLFSCAAPLNSHQVSTHITPIDSNHLDCTIDIALDQNEYLYRDSLVITCDHPAINVGQLHSNREAVTRYSPLFHENKQVFDKPTTFNVALTTAADANLANAHLHIGHLLSSQENVSETIIPLIHDQPKQIIDIKDIAPYSPQQMQINAAPIVNPPTNNATPTTNLESSWTEYLQNWVKSTESIWTRLLLVFLLGLLLSLTPCLYPMIPVTMGILQQQGTSSVMRNFILSLAYTVGIATTFAILGLLAALGGQLFGSLLANPIFIGIIIAIFAYLAFSMLGFYEMYIPRFLQPATQARGGSIGSAFVFGLISGSVASPCLSPGLALLLSIVASLGNYMLGFLLLFTFGIGMGIPLILIGTFSGSLGALPRAGAWMVEVKKLFGFLLLGMCFYYASNVVSWHLLLWVLGLTCLFLGVYFIFSTQQSDSAGVRLSKQLMGGLLVVGAIVSFFQAYQATFLTPTESVGELDTFWRHEYASALEQAKNTNKLVFIDFWGKTCSVCSAIDKKLLQQPAVRQALMANYVPVKIEASPSNEEYLQLKDQYDVVGVPTLLIIDPVDQRIVQRWASELYNVTPTAFIEKLNALAT